ncbi:MAG: hypothetical protein SGI92_06710 [Bryobacteraceae bacterium]|nr:hypothetical protein [Bryobacteraceae bacterium]
MRELAIVALVSVTAGAGLGWLSGDFAGSKLYGVQGRDVPMLITAVLLSLTVAAAATAIPALRATRIQPATALREE